MQYRCKFTPDKEGTRGAEGPATISEEDCCTVKLGLASNSYTCIGKQHELISSLYRLSIGPQSHVAYQVSMIESFMESITCRMLGIEPGWAGVAGDLCLNLSASRHKLHGRISAKFIRQRMLLKTAYQSGACATSSRIRSFDSILPA